MVKPLNNKLLVKVKEQTREVSGLIIASTEENIKRVAILAVADNITEVKVGDLVLVPADRMAKSEEGHLVDYKDVLAIVED